MFALEVEYLTGRVVATERHAREQAEWPPHPGRLFSALVDTAFQSLSDDGSGLPAGVRAALEWIEELPPPAIAAGDARRRQVIPAFVPVNDAETPKIKPGATPSAGQIADAVAVLPERRGRQPRFFPTVLPEQPVVHFIWQMAPGVEVHRQALEQLAKCMTYLGHSSSLVRVSVVDAPPDPVYVPDPNGQHTFRVVGRGRLRDLESHFRRNARPSPGLYAAYRKAGEKAAQPVLAARQESVFGDIIVCEIEGPHLPLPGTVKLTTAVRDALIAHVEADADAAIRGSVKSLVSGHTPTGDPGRDVHVAYVPLANVGHRYSDGKVMGFGVVLPRTLGRYSPERRAILRAVAGLERVWCEGPDWEAGPASGEPAVEARRGYSWVVTIPAGDAPGSLKTWAYTGPSRTWATVTPILCDRHPKDRDGERIEDIVATSVERIVGVRPTAIDVSPISRHLGVPPSHAFDNRRKAGLQPRHRAHVVIEFAEEVRGPIIAGAGRFAGLGLFRVYKPEGRR
ncbi:MAG TPA: type I-U CRISPR-associated protein Csb2 [Urbifossiella sp.]|jgi:CRISPR-associated protein Csb2|nr:type I-U CRISPR-associated protein Csb2 [Urbifossiella sp.]